MDTAASTAKLELEPLIEGAELRAAPRFTLLIRAAKLVSTQGEFVCVIRDVSETGISVRLFHTLPGCQQFALHMPAGGVYEIASVWQRGNEAGFSFETSVDVPKLISESGEYPKRGLRLELCFPVAVSTLTDRHEAVIENLSQQGARLECAGSLAIDQTIRMEMPGILALPGDHSAVRRVRAKVRWRRGSQYGLVFEDTFTLGEFARFAAWVQAPALLHEQPAGGI